MINNERGYREIEKLKDKLEAEKIKNRRLAEKLKEKDLDYAEFRSRLREAQLEKEKAQRELNKIKNSRLWKLTLPLRVAAVLWLRLFGKAKKQSLREMLGLELPERAKKAKETRQKKSYQGGPMLHPKNQAGEEALKDEAGARGSDKDPGSFVLYRIIGNDLYPRHRKGQSRENLRFILENEPPLAGCEKKFVVNRIIDSEEEQAVIDLLNEHGFAYIHVPFRPEAYRGVSLDTGCLPGPGYLAGEEYENLKLYLKNRVAGALNRLKNNYVMNNNGARNAALRDGRERARWVLPWDGNCFVTASAWEQIRRDVSAASHLKYFAVPMARVMNNRALLEDDFVPEPVEEPQLLFRNDAGEEFNEEYSYGRRPKVELFWRLGISGIWDNWGNDPWDQDRRPLSPEAGQFGTAGWVARLFSGMEKLEQGTAESFKQRGRVRAESIITTLRHTDKLISGASAERLQSFDEETLERERQNYLAGNDEALTETVNGLLAEAEAALLRGPYSVVDKTTLPPSGIIRDYWHPAPYWWPNPDTKDGLPYVSKDGWRVPGTEMYAPESEKYDRTRIQRVFDDSISLTLAWKFSGEEKYAAHAAKILERFFINPETRMNPHLNYAQVRLGHNDNRGFNHGIIELKDFYYYLDAVRLLDSAEAVSKVKLEYFKQWLDHYLEWLLKSPQGEKERRAVNNHGLYYDLQVASIAAFLEEEALLYDTLARAQSRIGVHFAPDGSQPEELKRTNTAHYCCFNFQGWLHLAQLASRWGVNFFVHEAENGAGLAKGGRWLMAHLGRTWPYEQAVEFDYERFLPAWFFLPEGISRLPMNTTVPGSAYLVKPKFYPHDGIKPYWNLGLAAGSKDDYCVRDLQFDRKRTFPVKSLLENVKLKASGLQDVAVYQKYFAYARELPEGEIIDLGTAQGGSTISLALGLKANPGGEKRLVYAFDQFCQYQEKPHPYNLVENPDDCVKKNIACFKENLANFGVEKITRIFPGVLEQFPTGLPADIAIGLLAIDTDGYIDRDLGIFFDHLLPGGILIIDDYKEMINRQGRDNLNKVAGYDLAGIEGFVEQTRGTINGGPRLLGKHLLTYRLVNYYIEKGAIEPLEQFGDTLFARKSTGRSFAEITGAGELARIKEGLEKDFVKKAAGSSTSVTERI